MDKNLKRLVDNIAAWSNQFLNLVFFLLRKCNQRSENNAIESFQL